MTTTRVPSVRQQQRLLTAELRAQHKTWVEIATTLADRFDLNPRVALRLARGWSQAEAADRWNQRWPAEPKTFKNFSYWEVWPSQSGHAPSLAVLTRLAELYECAVSDLIVDCPNFRRRDPAHNAREQAAAALPAMMDEQDADPAKVDASARSMDAPVDRLADLAERIDGMDVEELARVVASWTGNVAPTVSRRGLLLKLSAGLSLAAADPALASAEEAKPEVSVTAEPQSELSGIWFSHYAYYSHGQAAEFEGEHYVVLRQSGNRLVGQSLPHSTGSRLTLELSVDRPIATGTWKEQTSPDGYYKGAIYHGTIQLVINPMGREMSGKWLGFGKNFKVNSGDWDLSWVEDSTSQRVARKYHLKA